MNEKNDVQVIINGKQYTLCGYESSDYLQHIANHINEKFTEFKRREDYNRLDFDMRNILLAINLSDDFFKAQRLADELKGQKEELEQEIFDMKHELMKRDEELTILKEQQEELKQQKEETERQNIRLETELEQKNQELQKRAVQPVPVGQAGRPVTPVPQSVRTGRPVLNQTAQPGAPLAQPVLRAQATAVQTGMPVTGASQSADAPAVAASTVPVPPEKMVMTGIQPAPAAQESGAKSSIAAFELEKPVGTESGENPLNQSSKAKGRKNSGSKRSQNKKK